MATTMLVDDTRSEFAGVYGAELSHELARISQYRTARHNLSTWVANMWFLVYDGEDDAGDAEDEDEGDAGADERPKTRRSVTDSEAENQQSTTLSPQHDESQYSDRAMALSAEIQEQSESDEAPPTHDQSAGDSSQPGEFVIHSTPFTPRGKGKDECDTCLEYPRFPKRKRADCFRVVRFSPGARQRRRLCSHYVAVSYCWSAVRDGKRTYRVRVVEQDGTVVERDNRAPDEIIDRAVEFARTVGARLIWLDQECLPQDRSQEQELGIQRMDLVYQRAYWTAGLFESVIPSQRHLDSAMSVLDWAQRPHISQQRLRFRRGSNLTRHTLIQSLTEFLEILAQDPWNQRAWILQEYLCSATRLVLTIRTAGPLVYTVPGFLAQPAGENIFLRPSELQTLIQASQEFFSSTAGHPIPYGVVDLPSPTDFDHNRRFQAIASLSQLFPEIIRTNNPNPEMYALGKGNFGPRPICDAATSLSLLKTRYNSRLADRLAILANMCNYEIRLDTVAIENDFRSLATCSFALAILNGDLSLLIPDVYQIKFGSRFKATLEGPSWTRPFLDMLPCIDFRHQRDGSQAATRIPNLCRFTESSLIVPAYMWTVDRSIDLSSIRVKWKKTWESVSCHAVCFDDREGEDKKDFEERRKKARPLLDPTFPDSGDAQCPRPAALLQDNVDQLRDPAIGCRLWREVRTEALERHHTPRLVVSEILFDILRHLHNIGEHAAANSIWHSIRTDYRNTTSTPEGDQKESRLLPDDVADLLADKNLVNNPWETLQLSHNRGGSVNEAWLINRVMEDDVLWVGKYTNSEQKTSETQTLDDSEGSSSLAGEEGETCLNSSIVENQLTLQMVFFVLREATMERQAEQDGEDENINLNVGAHVAYVQSLHAKINGRFDKLASRVSVFDVDGPCTVVTPYDRDMEWLPRPALRNMNACWVVEPVSDDRGQQQQQQEQQEHAPTSRQADKQASRETHAAYERELMKQSEASEDGDGWPPPVGKFRVLRRVKAMWEIMEIPTEQYEFV